MGVAVAGWRSSVLGQNNPSLVSLSLAEEQPHGQPHQTPALFNTSTKNHNYKCISSSASMRLQQFASPLSQIPFDHDGAAQDPGSENGAAYKILFPKRGDSYLRSPSMHFGIQPQHCHNCGAVTGASYAGRASERKRFVITCKKENAPNNLRALVCIWMFLRLWVGMICFTWVLITRAGLWALLPDAPFEFCDRRSVPSISCWFWPRKYLLIFFFINLSLEKFNKVFWCLSGSCQWKSGSKW